ncbi:MAG: glycosyltransferase family 4 protein [Limisphaerales bacterium]
MEKYVCSFRGRRDSYQVPLALAEGGLLDGFITDFYAFSAIRSLSRHLTSGAREKINSRYEPEIPENKVTCLWRTTALEHLRHLLGRPTSATFAKLDQHFSRAAAARAGKTGANLFLYSPYAWEAFATDYRHHPRKVLFQFHPHQILERDILARNYASHPYVIDSYTEETGERLNANLQRRNQDAWRLADLIFCASSFTRKSLLAAGADGSKCRVVPYGVEPPAVNQYIKAPDAFCVLFAGSGIQRKGLHHLLIAWKNAALPKHSRLILVCRTIDKGIERLAKDSPGVELKRGVCGSVLSSLFCSSTLFAMPSLVEGFGQVYLEALSHGCPVLGTSNTCLPDLGNESDGIFIVPAVDNVDVLVHALESASMTLPGNDSIRQKARACAARFTWERFRKQIRRELTGG